MAALAHLTSRDGGNAKGLSGTILAMCFAAPAHPCAMAAPTFWGFYKISDGKGDRFIFAPPFTENKSVPFSVNDEALRGEWKKHRASRLIQQYRVIYRVERERVRVDVVSLTMHDYRKK
jgi:hypothetical protein